MAAYQGSWRAMAVMLKLSPGLRSDRVLSRLVAITFRTETLACLAPKPFGGEGDCSRCSSSCAHRHPKQLPPGHSPHASFKHVVDVLVHFGLRALPSVETELLVDRPSGEGGVLAKRWLAERFRGQLAAAGHAPFEKLCVSCGHRSSRLKQCTKCSAEYCSAECQRQHWPLHKGVCAKGGVNIAEINDCLREAGVF